MRARAELSVALALALGAACVPVMAQSNDGRLAATVGELVQIEAQRVLLEARRSQPGAPAKNAASAIVLPRASASAVADVIELLGIYKREREFAADVALNGVVRYVKTGDALGSYSIKSIGDRCVYLADVNRAELLRCVSMASEKPL
jgi:hypothetical protein